MSKWITDRQPVRNDSYEDSVWVMVMGHVVKNYWYNVELGDAWQPIVVETPEPYVAPNRWQMEWDSQYHQWLVRDAEGHIGAVLCSNSPSPEKYREAAERIAAIYNEVME